ncbi:hypothetical protein [Frankia sp. Cas3]|uniref:sensor histidine kinase n=1 Tax=Frankia sp. Cas3 TaxID=3073926 RepID=UPI002AD51488|nr:hypothetical protein [Frankia sp. Cas3]
MSLDAIARGLAPHVTKIDQRTLSTKIGRLFRDGIGRRAPKKWIYFEAQVTLGVPSELQDQELATCAALYRKAFPDANDCVPSATSKLADDDAHGFEPRRVAPWTLGRLLTIVSATDRLLHVTTECDQLTMECDQLKSVIKMMRHVCDTVHAPERLEQAQHDNDTLRSLRGQVQKAEQEKAAAQGERDEAIRARDAAVATRIATEEQCRRAEEAATVAGIRAQLATERLEQTHRDFDEQLQQAGERLRQANSQSATLISPARFTAYADDAVHRGRHRQHAAHAATAMKTWARAPLMFWRYNEQARRGADDRTELDASQQKLINTCASQQSLIELLEKEGDAVTNYGSLLAEYRALLQQIRGPLDQHKHLLDRESADRIAVAIKRLSALLETRLTAATGETITSDTADLSEVVNAVLTVLRHPADLRERVTVQIETKAAIQMPRKILHQVVANLLDNAISHSEPGTPIQINGMLLGKFDPKVHLRICHSVTRGGTAADTEPGVYAARRLVEQHGGRLLYVDKGTIAVDLCVARQVIPTPSTTIHVTPNSSGYVTEDGGRLLVDLSTN